MNKHPSCFPFLLALSVIVPALRGESDFRAGYRRPSAVPAPADNQNTPERDELGKMLFFDPRLSGNGAISCATCHNPSLGWTDALPVGRGEGHRKLGRRTPTIINAAFNPVQMWDGRFATLEQQAGGPMVSAAEMNVLPVDVVERLRTIPRYRELFRAAYGAQGISMETVTKAIAAYERTIISGEAPFDRYVAGKPDAISEPARRGFVLFNTKAGCASCHSGWNFTDGSFHDIGVVGSDPGRGKIIGIDELNNSFKTPTLRNIADRTPYTHNGSEATLRDVVELYNQGGRVKRPTLSSQIKPLNLTADEIDDLVAFLHTLTSQDTAVLMPKLPANEVNLVTSGTEATRAVAMSRPLSQ